MATRAQPQRRDDQPAFVLHAYPYRETSLIVEAFTPAYGRVAMVARGAKRPRSELRGLLQGFQPLLLCWSGEHELKTLQKAEWRGGLPRVGGSALFCGFYLNELLLKLVPREDPHPQLFADYEAALAELAAGQDQATVLRRFEVRLLSAMGYALPLVREADTGAPVDPGGPLPLRVRPRAAADGTRFGHPSAAGARHHAARARGADLSRRRDCRRGETADARSARPLSRAARCREPARGAGPAGARRGSGHAA